MLLLVAPACGEAAAPDAVPTRTAEPPRASARPAPEGWTSFRHPEQPWSWLHPEGWAIQTFDHAGLATHEGVVLTNVRHRFRHPHIPDGATSVWDFTGVPGHAVVIEMSQTIRLMGNCARTTDTPLHLAAAERVRGAHGSPPRRFLSICIRGQSGFGLHVWLGEEATAADREAVGRVVRSLRFVEPLETVTCDNEQATDLKQEPGHAEDYRQRWQTADGCEVRLDVVMTRTGSCYGPATGVVVMGWPFGTARDERAYVRDPGNVFGDSRVAGLVREETALPPDARDTLLRQYGTPQIWLVPGDDSFVYMVYADRIERWPLDPSPPDCG